MMDSEAIQLQTRVVQLWIMKILALTVTAGFFTVIFMLMFFDMPNASHEVLLVLLGSMGTAWTAIIGYFFGSSAGSAIKDSRRDGSPSGPSAAIAPILALVMLFGLSACASDKKATIRGDLNQAFVEGCADLPLAIATAKIADVYVKDKDMSTGIEVAEGVDDLCDLVLSAQAENAGGK